MAIDSSITTPLLEYENTFTLSIDTRLTALEQLVTGGTLASPPGSTVSMSGDITGPSNSASINPTASPQLARLGITTFIKFTEMISAPVGNVDLLPNQIALYAQDDGSGVTKLKLIDNANNVTVIGAAGGSGTIDSGTAYQMARLGLGVAAGLTDALKVQTAAMSNRVLDDTAHGAPQYFFGETLDGLRYDIRHGSATDPVTTVGPTFKISSYRNDVGGAVVSGTSPAGYSALQVQTVGHVDTTAQPSAIMARARTYANTSAIFPDTNPDATGILSYGHVESGGVGLGLAIFGRGSLANGSVVGEAHATGAEFQTWNGQTTDGTTPAPHAWTDTLAGANGYGSRTMGIWLPAEGAGTAYTNAVAIQIGKTGTTAPQWDVGIGFTGAAGGGTQGNAIKTASIRDDGNAPTSLMINGTHATAAIGIDSGAGYVGIGTLTPTAALDFGANAGVRSISDVHGDVLSAYFGTTGGGLTPPSGARWQIAHGSYTLDTEVTQELPTMKIDRSHNHTNEATVATTPTPTTAGVTLNAPHGFHASGYCTDGNTLRKYTRTGNALSFTPVWTTPALTPGVTLYETERSKPDPTTHPTGHTWWDPQFFSGLTVTTRGGTTDSTMPTGITTSGHTHSDIPYRTDACGLWTLGSVQGKGQGVGTSYSVGFGAYIEGRTVSDDGLGRAVGMEVQTTNAEKADVVKPSPYDEGKTKMMQMTFGTHINNDPHIPLTVVSGAVSGTPLRTLVNMSTTHGYKASDSVSFRDSEGTIIGTVIARGIGTTWWDFWASDLGLAVGSLPAGTVDAFQHPTGNPTYSTGDSLGMLGGLGILFRRQPEWSQFDVGIAVTPDLNPIRNAVLLDEGNSLYSILINGNHNTAAIAIAPQAGKFLVGALTTGFSTKAYIRSGNVNDSSLILQAFDGVQTTSIFSVVDGVTAATLFSVNPSGSVRINKWLSLAEQTSVGTPSTGYVNLYAEASGATTVLKLKDDQNIITTVGSGTASALDSGTAYQVARLGIGVVPDINHGLTFGVLAGYRSISDHQGTSYEMYNGNSVGNNGGQPVPTGNRVHMTQGFFTQGANGDPNTPSTDERPTAYIARYQNITAAARLYGRANAQWHSALTVVNRSASTDDTMVTGISVGAISTSTIGVEGSGETDSCAIVAEATHFGVGGAFGATIGGKRFNTAARARGAEITAASNISTDGDVLYASDYPGNNKQLGIHLNAKNFNNPALRGGVGLTFSNAGTAVSGQQMDVGIGFLSGSGAVGTGACYTADISIDDKALTGIRIGGFHATNALSVSTGAGKITFGGLDWNARLAVRPASDGDFGLVVQQFSNTQTSPLLTLRKADLGALLTEFDATGKLGIGVSPTSALDIFAASDQVNIVSSSGRVGLILDGGAVVNSTANIFFREAGVNQWQFQRGAANTTGGSFRFIRSVAQAEGLQTGLSGTQPTAEIQTTGAWQFNNYVNFSAIANATFDNKAIDITGIMDATFPSSDEKSLVRLRGGMTATGGSNVDRGAFAGRFADDVTYDGAAQTGQVGDLGSTRRAIIDLQTAQTTRGAYTMFSGRGDMTDVTDVTVVRTANRLAPVLLAGSPTPVTSWNITAVDTTPAGPGSTGGTFTTSGNHLFVNGTPVIFAGTAPPAGIILGTVYYVRGTPSKTTFKVTASPGGLPIIIPTSQGTSVKVVLRALVSGQEFIMKSGAPDPLINGNHYYATNVTSAGFEVENAPGSGFITLTSAGTTPKISPVAYAEMFCLVGNMTANRKGGLVGGVEMGMHATAGIIARLHGYVAVVNEENPLSAYQALGSDSKWAKTGARAFWATSSGSERAGTGIFLAGGHAYANSDTQDWERGIVLNVGGSTNVPGTDVFIVKGDGSIGGGLYSGTGGFGAPLSALGEMQGGSRAATTNGGVDGLTGDGVALRGWHMSASGQLDFYRDTYGGSNLRMYFSDDVQPRFRYNGQTNLLEFGGGALPVDVSIGRLNPGAIAVSGGPFTIVDGTGSGYLELTEQSVSPAVPGASNARLFVADNGSGYSLVKIRDINGIGTVVAPIHNKARWMSAQLASTNGGTNMPPSNSQTIYYSECWVGTACALTGIEFLKGTTVNTATEIIVTLHDGAGNIRAFSPFLAGTRATVSTGGAAWQQVPFTNPINVRAGLYYVGVWFSDTNSQFRTWTGAYRLITGLHSAGLFGAGTPPSLTSASITWTPDIGPIAGVY